MKPLILLALLAGLAGASGQLRPETTPIRSVSGQFVVSPQAHSISRFYTGSENSIPLDPAVLAVSAERIKQVLWRRLEVSGAHKGKVFLRVRPARFAYEQPTILVDRGLGGWNCKLDIPDAVAPPVLLRTLVHTLLLEIANRGADAHAAEIPLWLAEGLSQELLATERIEYLVPPSQAKDRENGFLVRRVTVNERRGDSIAQAAQILRDQPPLTFEQLSWPSPQQLTENNISSFRGSAQLFVRQLELLKDGTACLRRTMQELPRHMNWQFAFLAGFEPHFKTQLDVEKWWALQVVQFTGRDLTQVWTTEISWEKLDQIVRAPAEVRSNPRELPQRVEITLQGIIRDWDGLHQRPALQRKRQELDLIRPRVSQDLVGLVDDYRLLLGRYLEKQNFAGSFFGIRKQQGPIRNRLSEAAIQQLNVLEARRMALQPTASPDGTRNVTAVSPAAP